MRNVVARGCAYGGASRDSNPGAANAGHEIADEEAKHACALANRWLGLGRQSTHQPVGFSGGVARYVREADQFELRRSPGTQVSERVAAVNDYRARAVEQLGCIADDVRQRNVKGA